MDNCQLNGSTISKIIQEENRVTIFLDSGLHFMLYSKVPIKINMFNIPLFLLKGATYGNAKV